MKRFAIIILLTAIVASAYSQRVFDETVAQKVHSLILNKEHDVADSILNVYERESQTDDSEYLINLLRILNGYRKIQTTQDISTIISYSKAGKKAFCYLYKNINKDNAELLNLWPIIISFAEIYNYLEDSIMVDVELFADQYYNDFRQNDLDSYFAVKKNIYQYYSSVGRLDDAVRCMVAFYNATKEVNDTTMMKPVCAAYIGEALFLKKDYSKAKEWLLLSYNQFKNKTNKISPLYCNVLENLAMSFVLHNSNYVKSCNYAKELCEANEIVYGKMSSQYVDALAKLGGTEISAGKIDDGLSHLEKAVKMLDMVSGFEDSDKQIYITQLGISNLYLGRNLDYIQTQLSDYPFLNAIYFFQNGEYERAISILVNNITTFENNNDLSNPFYIYSLGYLSLIYIKQGKYAEADKVINHSIEVLKNYEQKKGIRDDLSIIYMSKGQLNLALYNIDEALYWFNEVKSTYSNEFKNTSSYARVLSNLAVCYNKKGEYSLAKEYADEAYTIYSNYLGKYKSTNYEFLLELHNLACSYGYLNDNKKAIELLELIIDNSKDKQNESIRGIASYNIAILYLFEGDIDKAEHYLNNARRINMPSYHIMDADFYYILVKSIKGDSDIFSLLSLFNEKLRDNIADVFGQFTEQEREDYWCQNSRKILCANNLVASMFKNSDVLRTAYDNTLFTKSMLLNSNKLLEKAIKYCDNNYTIADFIKMKKIKNDLCNKSINKDSILYLKDSIRTMEKRIIESIPDFKNRLISQFKTIDDVKNMLSTNEVAIEFTLIPHVAFPLEKTNYIIGAYILNKDNESPALAELCNNDDIYKLCYTDNLSTKDQTDSLYNLSDNRLYNLLWKKIEPYIERGSTIYFSPSGAINKINISAISNGYNRLSDIYNFYEVSSTANIEEVKHNIHTSKSATLYGDINYYEDMDMMSDNSKLYSSYSPGDMIATRSITRGAWDLLPGTKEEILSIGEMMKDRDINYVIYDKNTASEESFKALNGNATDIIHISTHGYYYPSGNNKTFIFDNVNSYTKRDLSMFRSGLLFAGANNAWTGKNVPYGVEDGILTADEISRIDLSKNKLIVLSACETALGDVDDVDGVLGLQKGLKKAGVATVLMSLWKVPDEETKQLMTLFYNHFLSGESAHQSLKLAQQELSDMGKSPYYWAGFKLLD